MFDEKFLVCTWYSRNKNVNWYPVTDKLKTVLFALWNVFVYFWASERKEFIGRETVTDIIYLKNYI